MRVHQKKVIEKVETKVIKIQTKVNPVCKKGSNIILKESDKKQHSMLPKVHLRGDICHSPILSIACAQRWLWKHTRPETTTLINCLGLLISEQIVTTLLFESDEIFSPIFVFEKCAGLGPGPHN